MMELKNDEQGLIISYVKDIPNLCSLSGLLCSFLAIYFIVLGDYDVAMIAMVWAVSFDWADGIIARKTLNRTDSEKKFGGVLDTLIDIVSFGVVPAILLISYGDFDVVYFIVAFFMLVSAAIRLSYFSIFGLSKEGKYTGLALDNNSLFIVFLFMFESIISKPVFSTMLLISFSILCILNVSQIMTPKLSGNNRNVYILAAYTIGVTIFYSWSYIDDYYFFYNT